jgi:hypothetical protein
VRPPIANTSIQEIENLRYGAKKSLQKTAGKALGSEAYSRI